MLSCNKARKLLKFSSTISNQCGFSLVELLVAMLILLLIIFAFTPLLAGSVARINYAGDKTEALLESQSLLEVSIAERIVNEGGTSLLFTFNNSEDVTVEIEVPGDLISVDVDKGEAIAHLSGFIPYLPNIAFTEPLSIKEGYTGEVKISGIYTDLEKAGSIKIYPENSPNSISAFSLTGITSSDDVESASFSLSSMLKVSNNPYIAQVEWNKLGVGTITVKLRFYVSRPDIVSVGSGQRIWVTPDAGANWAQRAILSGSGELKDVAWMSPSKCVAVSSNGSVMVWDVAGEPQVSAQKGAQLNAVFFGGGKYLAAGNLGNILYADNEQDFLSGTLTKIGVANENNLHAIGWNGTEFLIVGDAGTTLVSTNGSEFGSISPAQAVYSSLYGIAYNQDLQEWVAVGGNSDGSAAVFMMSSSDTSWRVADNLEIPTGSNSLNAVIYRAGLYVAVGSSGTVLTSTDSVIWTEIPNITTTSHLFAIDYGKLSEEGDSDDFIIVGSSGAVIIASYFSDSENSWTIEIGNGISHDIRGVAVRADVQ